MKNYGSSTVTQEATEQVAAETGELVHFDTNSEDVLDDEGEPRFGWFWRIVDANQNPLTELIGPYRDAKQASEACMASWANNSYATA